MIWIGDVQIIWKSENNFNIGITTFDIFFTYPLQGFLRKGITTNNLYYISLQKYSLYFPFPIKNSFIETEHILHANAKCIFLYMCLELVDIVMISMHRKYVMSVTHL